MIFQPVLYLRQRTEQQRTDTWIECVLVHILCKQLEESNAFDSPMPQMKSDKPNVVISWEQWNLSII